MNIIYNASLMCMDLFRIQEQLSIINQECQMLHVDIMDGHFCKNLTLGVDFVKSIRPHTELPIEIHLMVTTPNDFIDRFLDAGADYISLHAETINADAFRTIHKILDRGGKLGIVLNPATPISVIDTYLGYIDLLTIMTVDIGMPDKNSFPKCCRKLKKLTGLKPTEATSMFCKAMVLITAVLTAPSTEPVCEAM